MLKGLISLIFLLHSRVYLTNAQGVKHNILDYETQLQKDLLKGYEKDVHPMIGGSSGSILVKFDVQLIRVLEINERAQLIKVYLWVNQYWNNPMLRWSPDEYDNITTIYIDPGKVWVPDIVLYNSIDENGQFSGGSEIYRHKIQIRYDGSHSWLNPAAFRSICTIDVSYFPFDDQQCQLKFGSWAHDSSMIDMAVPKNVTSENSYYIKNGEWELLALKAQRNSMKYQCCKMPFIDLTLTIKLRRQAISYQMTLIIPCALLSSLVYLGFILPPESGERIGLSITVLLAVTVFQEMTSQIMPAFDFPFLAQYYLATIFQTAFSLIITTVILNVYHRSEREMPRLVKLILLQWMHPLLFCTSKKPKDPDGKTSATEEPATTSGRRARKVSYQENTCANNNKNRKVSSTKLPFLEDEQISMKEDLAVIKTQVNHIRKLSQQHTHQQANIQQHESEHVQIAITEPDGNNLSVDGAWDFMFTPEKSHIGTISMSTPDISARRERDSDETNTPCSKPSQSTDPVFRTANTQHSSNSFKAIDPVDTQKKRESWINRRKTRLTTQANSETRFAIGESLRSSAFVLLGEKAAAQTNKRYVKLTAQQRERIKKERQRDWTVAARVLDRFFLILFIITSNTLIFVIFFRAPRFGMIS